MKLPFVSRVRFEMLEAENERLMAELEHERAERSRAVDTMLANARLAPIHREDAAKVRGQRKIPRRLRMIDLQRRLERAEADPGELR